MTEDFKFPSVEEINKRLIDLYEIKKIGTKVPFSWETLAGPRGEYKHVKIAPTWFQHIWFAGSRALFALSEWLRKVSERSPWVYAAGGYEYDPAMHEAFTVKEKAVRVDLEG